MNKNGKITYLLIDGYNIIFAWKKLKKISAYSLEDARDKLIEILSNYNGYRKYQIILVFDAHMVKGGTGSEFTKSGIYVVFTHEAELADHYIERSSHVLAKDNNVIVATSDNLEQIIILGAGAYRMSAKDLELEINSVQQKIREQLSAAKPIKNNQLLDNLDPATLEKMEKMRRGL